MRIATYNVEWFTRLFDDDGHLLDDGEWSGRWNVTRSAQIAALTRVFRSLDADMVMVIEAPDTSPHRDGARALETFARHAGLRARCAVIGFPNDTKQEIICLHDPEVLEIEHDPQASDDAPRFDGTYRMPGKDGGGEIVFSKPPLELQVRARAGGQTFRAIGVHAKSKHVRGAGGAEERAAQAIENRRKHLGQCLWVRARAEALMASGAPVVVMGDLNDGIGLDTYERSVGRSGLDVLVDAAGDRPLFDPHALDGGAERSARFWLEDQESWMEAMLDYILVSPDLAATRPVWRIWHPLRAEAGMGPDLGHALLTASDHFPVTLDLTLAPDDHRAT